MRLAGKVAVVTGGGSGIGLILSRQIAEAHGGTLQLSNRKDRTGAEATLSLPLASV